MSRFLKCTLIYYLTRLLFCVLLLTLSAQLVYASKKSCRELLSSNISSSKTKKNTFAKSFIEPISRPLISPTQKLYLEHQNDPKFKLWFLAHYTIPREDLLEARLLDPHASEGRGYKTKTTDYVLGYAEARELAYNMPLDKLLTLDGLSKLHQAFMSDHPHESIAQKYGRVSTRPYARLKRRELGKIRDFEIGFESNDEKPNQTNFDQDELGDSLRYLFSDDPKFDFKYLSNKSLLTAYYPKSWNAVLKMNPYLTKTKNWVGFLELKSWRRFKNELSTDLINDLIVAERKGIIANESDTRRAPLVYRLTSELLSKLLEDIKLKLNSKDSIKDLKFYIPTAAQFMWPFYQFIPLKMVTDA